ncbi:uncharacterized protein [Sinocyclocheilus grahami]|uniref:uncharacterized protein n=1 Tax=Sinocyclocheilus grahami TaxID=75366 RepID=UPI0007AC57B3|nr:PREDICTED: uncharacterized protein LOC107559768 [Sinocyclocheilus grahami]
MGKNRKRLRGKGAAQAPGAGAQHGMRPAAPPPPHGFRGAAPVRPMGPPGQRFPAPLRDFGPQPPRTVMMGNMEEDRGFMREPQGLTMDGIPDRRLDGPDPHFHHPPEFGNRPPAPRFYRPELEYALHSPEFDDRPPDFCPPEFEGGPGFHRMDPGFARVEQYGPADPHYMPQLDVHGNRAFGDRGGFAGPLPPDFRGPGPVQPPTEAFNATSMAPPVKGCPPQPPKKKDQPAPKETEPPKSMASKISKFKNISANTPRGRSLGVISFIGNNCGFIEREDLKKFSFIFDAFFGNRAHLVPGVKVHFTAVKNLGKECAVDVKVSPGGTEDIDSTMYEGVVLTALPDDDVKEANPGRIRTVISKDPIILPFGKADINVTLLLYDRVEFQLLTNVITKEQRATNIKPKTPNTFQLTKEIREMGVVKNKSDGTLTIITEKHDNLTASATDNLSDDELNVMDEVELTILTVNNTKKAVRLKKLPEGSVTFNQKAKGNEKWKPVTMEAGSQDSVSLDVSSEKYEGTITKIAPKKSPSQENVVGFHPPILISWFSLIRFGAELCREGLVDKLDDHFGFIKTQQDPQLFFYLSEVMEDTKLTLSEKVEFTLVLSQAAEGGKQAVRIRRLNESVFTSATKLEAFGVKEKKKMTIKLLKHPKDQFKEEVETEDKGSESMDVDKPNKGKDRVRSISRENSQRRYSRSRSRSQDRSMSCYRSSSPERRDGQYRYKRCRSKERGEGYRRSRSRSKERSSQSARKRSCSPADTKRVKSPDNVEELLRKRRELMELNELIARKKAIVAMEQNAKQIEPEDGKSGVTTFDYQHVHHENIWMPDLKPVKSILKKQSEPHTDSQSQASTSKETAAFFVKSQSQKMQIGYPQQTCAFGSNTPGCSTFESTAERTLTTASLTPIQDPEFVRKKKQIEDLSESIARKKAITAIEQKVKVVREMPEMETEYKFDSHTENQFVMSKGNLWSCEIKPTIQLKKSILKKCSGILSQVCSLWILPYLLGCLQKKMTIKLLKHPKDQFKEEVETEDKGSESMDVDKPNKGKDRVRSISRENSQRRYSRSRSRSQDRSMSCYRSSSPERRDGQYRYKRCRSKERGEGYRRSRSRSKERSSQSARKRSCSPADTKRVKSPDNVEELLRKRRELMELNELIARKKAIVAMEQNAKQIEPEDGKSGVTTFDYQHVHHENIWMPDLKPVKSILKKQSEPHTDSQSQASTSKETAAFFVKSQSQKMQIGYPQQTCAFGSNTPGCSTFESTAERTLTTASLTPIQDPEFVRKKKQIEDLSESIARKKAITAIEQKVKVVREMPEMETEYKFDSHTENQFVMSKGNLWSCEIKPTIQLKKSILKKCSGILSQSDTTSVDEYGQPSQDDDSFTKPPSQTAALPFNRSSNPQPIHPGTLGLFNRIMNESSTASQMTETPLFNKPVIPQSLMQASSSRSLHDLKISNVSKGNNSQEDQHRASSRLPHDHPPSSNPSSQTSPSDPKRNLPTQMERFLSALNKADTSVVNSLFQEARKDLALMKTQKPTQPQLDRSIPFMDEIYDPFKEDEDNYQPSLMRKQPGRERVNTETHLSNPSKDDLLPHERTVQESSGFSRLFGMRYGVDPTAKAEKKSLYGHPMVSENWSAHKEGPNQFSGPWNQYEEGTNLCATEHKHYTDDGSLYRDRSRSVEYQKVNPNVQHSYVEDREMPDSNFDKSLACQVSQESSEDKVRKSENFEKIQSLLQTIGLHLDTAEVSKLADRTQERLYGKMRKPQTSKSHSFEQKREQSVSQTEQRGSSSRADSSDSESFRSVSPAQSSSRKVYMSYKDSVKYKDQHKVEDVDLTRIKRTVVNLKPATDEQDPYKPELTAVSQASYPPVTIATTVQPDGSQYVQNSTVSTFSASQYSQYQSSDQHVWGSVVPGLYPYGTVPSSPYAIGHQAMAPHIMPAYSSYPAQMANPYCVLPPLSMPHPYGPLSTLNPLHLSAMASAYTNQAASQIPTESINTTPVRCLKKIKTVPTVKAGPATITEDDIKARQKIRLEQFNQRMKLKKEQQMEAQRSRGQNRNSAPGKSIPDEIKNVWIFGHSLVFWAEKRATSPEYGMQLGMHPDSVRIWWKGVQGMTWQQLVPLLLQRKDNWPKPDVLIIHLGGNDISTTAPEAFIETVKKDMSSLKSIFPKCRLVWSSILSRQSWRGTEASKEMDIIRMAINKSICTIMTELGGFALRHCNITPSSGLYRPDGIHLSGNGIDVFNLNMQAFLEKWERKTNKTETSDPSV